jgi:CheY-like chemotaxis protein
MTEAGDGRRPVAIIADDEPDIRELLAVLLTRAGYDVHEAADGEEALCLAREHHPAVAVLDVRMPRLDGYETTRALRADPSTTDMKVVILTASVRDSERLHALAAGADLYLRKPFGGRDLARRIRELVEGG